MRQIGVDNASIIAPTKCDAMHRRGYSVHVRQKLVDVTNYAISEDRSKRKRDRGVLRNVFITDISPVFPLKIMAGRGWRETVANNTHSIDYTDNRFSSRLPLGKRGARTKKKPRGDFV